MLSQIQVSEYIKRTLTGNRYHTTGEVTTVKRYYGAQAVKEAKRDAGFDFNADPKVVEVQVFDDFGDEVLHLEKNAMTKKCITRVSA